MDSVKVRCFPTASKSSSATSGSSRWQWFKRKKSRAGEPPGPETPRREFVPPPTPGPDPSPPSSSTAPQSWVVGIDLGTSFTCVAVSGDKGTVDIVPNDLGERITPSFVAIAGNEHLVGSAARTYGTSHPEQAIFEVKRLMGRLYDEGCVQEDAKMWPFHVRKGPHGEALVGVFKGPAAGEVTTFEPEEISAILLRKMKEMAENFIGGRTITDAVITVPAYFNDSQRRATREAGKRAGLNVLRLLNEPTAAALAYGHQNLLGSKSYGKKILVFDLGGGTFDVSIITAEASAEDESKFTVNAVAGDTHLGGADLDNRLVKFVAGKFTRDSGVDILTDRRLLAQAKQAAMRAKERLSNLWETVVCMEVGGKPISTEITRAAFESLNGDYFDKCITIVEKALRSANMKKREITDVLLVGGSTWIPIVREKLSAFFGTPPLACLHPDEAVAYGAAVQARLIVDSRCQEAADDCQSNVRRPALGTPATAGRPPLRLRGILVRDVAPLTIGLDSGLDFMISLIPRFTLIPHEAEHLCCCDSDDQREFNFKLYEGERAACSGNRSLGGFLLTGFIPAPASGEPVARIIVKMDRDGILEVTAEATANNAELGKKAGVKVETVLRRVGTDDPHVAPALAGAADCNTPEAEAEDAALTAAYESRVKLQTLAWSIRGRSALMRGNDDEATKKAVDVSSWLRWQSSLQPKLEYDKRLEELEKLAGCAANASSHQRRTRLRA